MSIFDNVAFDRHERVAFCNDPVTGLKAIVAIHSSARGPAAGGCRFWRYDSEDAAITDALRLAQGMSYKNAMAGLDLGGGKAVIMAPDSGELDEPMLEAFGAFVNTLGGAYITAEDVGMSVGKMEVVARRTSYVTGLPPKQGVAGGDPSPKTADGVFAGIRAAVRYKLGRDSLDGLRVAVQGVGSVGWHLCQLLFDAGAKLIVADINAERVALAREQLGAEVVALDSILESDVDVLSPCALGAILNAQSIPRLRAGIIAGAANNQLATDADGKRLFEAGVLYCPDFVINAGGIINVACEYAGDVSDAVVNEKVRAIGDRLIQIFELSDAQKRPTHIIANEQARRLIGRDDG
ncbi:MAG: Glu/Leu/Phe/Val dehydrogenase dimerization domain-containing protein [Pseudomonadota bacterium]